MATGSRRKRVRHTLDISFDSEAAKDAFTTRLSAVRSILTPRGRARLHNRDLLLALFDCATAQYGDRGVDDKDLSASSTGSFSRNSGLFSKKSTTFDVVCTGRCGDRSEPQQLFIGEYQTFVDLCNTLGEPCVDGGRWKLGSVVQVHMYRHATSHDPHLTDNFLRKDTFYGWSLCVPSTGCTNKPGAAHGSLVDAFWCIRSMCYACSIATVVYFFA